MNGNPKPPDKGPDEIIDELLDPGTPDPAFLHKPFTAGSLGRKIREVLELEGVAAERP